MLNLKKKYLIIIILLILILFPAVLSGCGVYNSDTAKNDLSYLSNDITGEKVTLEYYIWSDEESYIRSVIKAYCALNTNITINLHVIDTDFYENDIRALLSGDTKIDLLGVRGISQMVMIYDMGLLLDLTPYMKSSGMDITVYGSMFNDIAIHSRYYGIPARSTCWILLYNKDLFDAAHMPYPGEMTWDEYRQLAISLTRGEGKNKIYGGFWVPWCYNFAALQQSSYLIDDDLTPTRQSLELLNNFYNIDHSHYSFTKIHNQEVDYREEFEKGNIAMMPQGEWIVNMLLEDQAKGLTDINWDIAPMPVLKGQNAGITWGQYQFVSIAADSAHPREAFDFIHFLCGEAGARIYAQNGIIHAYVNDDIKQLYLKAVGKESASIFFEAKRVQEQLAVSGYQEVTEAFKTCAENYLLGKCTLDEAMDEINRKRTEILNP